MNQKPVKKLKCFLKSVPHCVILGCFFFSSCFAPLAIKRFSSDGEEKACAAQYSCLKKGMSEEEVRSLLGRPLYQEVWKLPNQDEITFLFYPSIDAEGNADVNDPVPLAFREDKLTNWEDSYYQTIKMNAQKI